ncbi:coxsackievirus and adenovirus receptor-like [Oreochromis niloticus]|uniref:coxsackievirus and adenovirus receptor-like n=1 Tax=Oreochromis niloticus TaxID=8128 RepID=UPI000905CEAB|nr:coxsackievirus and adenovirus receptor-like [Oreochromis niloticus]
MFRSPCRILFICVVVFISAVSDQKIITVPSGQNVTLRCRAPSNNIIVVEWSRADLGKECVLMYRDELFVPDDQHPSFKNRVDLQDRQMKDGDVSLILKNVMISDTGTYECRVFRKTNRRKRAHLKTPPISIITLSVVDPPGQTGGRREGGDNGGHPGLVASRSFLVLLLLLLGVNLELIL